MLIPNILKYVAIISIIIIGSIFSGMYLFDFSQNTVVTSSNIRPSSVFRKTVIVDCYTWGDFTPKLREDDIEEFFDCDVDINKKNLEYSPNDLLSNENLDKARDIIRNIIIDNCPDSDCEENYKDYVAVYVYNLDNEKNYLSFIFRKDNQKDRNSSINKFLFFLSNKEVCGLREDSSMISYEKNKLQIKDKDIYFRKNREKEDIFRSWFYTFFYPFYGIFNRLFS